MVVRVPIAGGVCREVGSIDSLEPLIGGPNDLICVWYGQGAAREEVVLKVDEEECVAWLQVKLSHRY